MAVVARLCIRTCFAHTIYVSYGTLVVRRTLGYFGYGTLVVQRTLGYSGNIHDTPCGDVVRTLGYSWNIYDTPGGVSTPTYLSTKYSSRSEAYLYYTV